MRYRPADPRSEPLATAFTGDANDDAFAADRLSLQTERLGVACHASGGGMLMDQALIITDARFRMYRKTALRSARDARPIAAEVPMLIAPNVRRRCSNWLLYVFTPLLAAAGPAAAQQIEVVNRTNIAAPIPTDGWGSGPAALSRNGRYVLLHSNASNLVSGDRNGVTDVFVLDNADGMFERINLSPAGEQTVHADLAGRGGVSDDGRYVLFSVRKFADTPGFDVIQVYLRDRQTGTNRLLSREGGVGGGFRPSYANDLSADGRYSVYTQFHSTILGDTTDVWRYDAQTDQSTRVSVSPTGSDGNGRSFNAELSADGRYVLFYSHASNLVADDTNQALDTFLRDMDSGVTRRVSVSSSGLQLTAPLAGSPSPNYRDYTSRHLSADGRYALFDTVENAAPDDTNGLTDVYRFDAQTGTTRRISTGTSTGGSSASISTDGQRIAFQSRPPQPAASTRIYVRDLAADSLQQLPLTIAPWSESTAYGNLVLAGSGSMVYFTSDVMPGASGTHVHRYDIASTTLQCMTCNGSPRPYANDNSGGDDDLGPALSDDGRFVAFSSLARNLVTGDNNGVADVFVRDRLTGTTERISRRGNGTESSCASEDPSITPDGRFVVFASCGDLVAPASGARLEVYRYDRSSGQLDLVSMNAQGGRADEESTHPHIAADGQTVVFASRATDLVTGGTNRGGPHVFIRRMTAAVTDLVSRTATGLPANSASLAPQISADGSSVVFYSTSTDLIAGDNNLKADVFVFNTHSLATERVNLSSAGGESIGEVGEYGISGDGSRVVFSSNATDLVAATTTERMRSFLRDRTAGTTRLIVPQNNPLNYSFDPDISADGRRITFISMTPGQVTPGDTSEGFRIYLYDDADASYRALTWYNQTYIEPHLIHRSPRLAADGKSVGFVSSRKDLADDGNSRLLDVFLVHSYTDELFSDGFQP